LAGWRGRRLRPRGGRPRAAAGGRDGSDGARPGPAGPTGAGRVEPI